MSPKGSLDRAPAILSKMVLLGICCTGSTDIASKKRNLGRAGSNLSLQGTMILRMTSPLKI
jgi:hypothetical protein